MSTTDLKELARNQLAMWENDLAQSVVDLETSKRFGDRGGEEWYKEKISFAQRKILELTEYLDHSRKGA